MLATPLHLALLQAVLKWLPWACTASPGMSILQDARLSASAACGPTLAWMALTRRLCLLSGQWGWLDCSRTSRTAWALASTWSTTTARYGSGGQQQYCHSAAHLSGHCLVQVLRRIGPPCDARFAQLSTHHHMSHVTGHRLGACWHPCADL